MLIFRQNFNKIKSSSSVAEPTFVNYIKTSLQFFFSTKISHRSLFCDSMKSISGVEEFIFCATQDRNSIFSSSRVVHSSVASDRLLQGLPLGCC